MATCALYNSNINIEFVGFVVTGTFNNVAMSLFMMVIIQGAVTPGTWDVMLATSNTFASRQMIQAGVTPSSGDITFYYPHYINQAYHLQTGGTLKGHYTYTTVRYRKDVGSQSLTSASSPTPTCHGTGVTYTQTIDEAQHVRTGTATLLLPPPPPEARTSTLSLYPRPPTARTATLSLVATDVTTTTTTPAATTTTTTPAATTTTTTPAATGATPTSAPNTLAPAVTTVYYTPVISMIVSGSLATFNRTHFAEQAARIVNGNTSDIYTLAGSNATSAVVGVSDVEFVFVGAGSVVIAFRIAVRGSGLSSPTAAVFRQAAMSATYFTSTYPIEFMDVVELSGAAVRHGTVIMAGAVLCMALTAVVALL